VHSKQGRGACTISRANTGALQTGAGCMHHFACRHSCSPTKGGAHAPFLARTPRPSGPPPFSWLCRLAVPQWTPGPWSPAADPVWALQGDALGGGAQGALQRQLPGVLTPSLQQHTWERTAAGAAGVHVSERAGRSMRCRCPARAHEADQVMHHLGACGADLQCFPRLHRSQSQCAVQ